MVDRCLTSAPLRIYHGWNLSRKIRFRRMTLICFRGLQAGDMARKNSSYMHWESADDCMNMKVCLLRRWVTWSGIKVDSVGCPWLFPDLARLLLSPNACFLLATLLAYLKSFQTSFAGTTSPAVLRYGNWPILHSKTTCKEACTADSPQVAACKGEGLHQEECSKRCQYLGQL